MRAVIQRVTSANVTVNSQKISSISQGLVVFIGINKDDTIMDVDNLVKTIAKLRIFDELKDGEQKRWRQTIKDIQGEILCISQFTLQAKLKKSKPDFHTAAKGPEAKILYTEILNGLQKILGEDKIKDGVFGAMMKVHLVNDGPVTINYDTRL
ncbi:D-tyrosyl-tRNA(Tyr) deacylase [Pneumocystis murina B123]|uniref:D-aminoacyl-tRNA deacylase n=1 Tax=Pneumocystis murina (strain B123) TaxID=1069680 RepID=M7NS24_PNEMU|nr:D-tyrosyl-tRNA(Tyr) deacylase [Pneumocystis murina B123]EMR10082.1 D-tyrosyl-tRNA(Tyr) deacylase [Pneumocystis murina B123]